MNHVPLFQDLCHLRDNAPADISSVNKYGCVLAINLLNYLTVEKKSGESREKSTKKKIYDLKIQSPPEWEF